VVILGDGHSKEVIKVKLGQKSRTLKLFIRRDTNKLTSSSLFLSKGIYQGNDTQDIGRRWLSTSQEESPHQKPNRPDPNLRLPASRL
jgi:hypothetical protein